MKSNFSLLSALLLSWLLGSFCYAQIDPNLKIDFDQLPQQEQSLLQTAADVWPQLDAEAQSRLRAQAHHWLTLTRPQQQALMLKQQHWDKLSFAEKARQRAQFAAWESLGHTDQTKIMAAYQQWRVLTIEQQQALKTKFAQQLPDYQAAWSYGPSLATDIPALQDWLSFVPPSESNPWLTLLRHLNSEDRATLATLGRQWNQKEKDRFRSRLLSTPDNARSAMINSVLVSP